MAMRPFNPYALLNPTPMARALPPNRGTAFADGAAPRFGRLSRALGGGFGLMLTGLLGLACPSVPSTDVGDVPITDVVGGFEDHAALSFDSVQAFHDWGDVGETPIQVKFTLTDFSAQEGHAFFYDPSFYKLHDEWYWFRLLNGEQIPLFPVTPVAGLSFASVDAIYDHFTGEVDLPLDLRWTQGERLYSPLFYDAALGWNDFEGKRFFGVGSVLYYPANPERVFPGEIYCFELEYIDASDEGQVQHFFDRLKAKLPEEIGTKLKWLSRGSAHQDELAASLKAGGGPLKDKVLTYADLVVPGQEVPYNEGITAGYVKLFEGSVGGTQVKVHDIVVLASVPDYLPPVSGIVTAVPQTPLAHLNLLAKARGTPNIYIGGIFTHQWLEEWSYWNKPVILKVASEGAKWQLISKTNYQAYLDKLMGADLEIEAIDLENAPYTADLATGGLEDIAGLVPLTGGKCAGMLSFLEFEAMETPLLPFAVTIRGYHEHLKSYRPLLEAALEDEDFQTDARVRFVFLEGAEDFLAEHASDPGAAPWLESWLEANGPAGGLGGAVAVGGFKQLLRAKPLKGAFLDTLQEALSSRYAMLSQAQGLRFRSSSTAEDIKGFNGAGLYDSNTGFLFPQAQETAKLKKRSIEWAVKKTWASYWSFEAFEERALAGIDHLSGNMGVLVHPRFDDPLELANGVITLTLKRLASGDELEMVLNVQKGAISVTNPDPQHPTTPEVDHVKGLAGAPGTVTRVQGSSEVGAGEFVLEEAELLWIYDQVAQLADAWLDEENKAWPQAQQSSTLVLDFEFKRMAGAWPQLKEPAPNQDRIIFKQVRTLESAIKVAENLQAEPVPRDVLTVTRKVSLRTCSGPDMEVDLVEFYTEEAKSDLLDHVEQPFVARIIVEFKEPVPGFEVGTSPKGIAHMGWDTLSYGGFPTESWELDMTLGAQLAADVGWERFQISQAGTWSLTNDSTTHEGGTLTCEVETLSVGPTEFLESLLDP